MGLFTLVGDLAKVGIGVTKTVTSMGRTAAKGAKLLFGSKIGKLAAGFGIATALLANPKDGNSIGSRIKSTFTDFVSSIGQSIAGYVGNKGVELAATGIGVAQNAAEMGAGLEAAVEAGDGTMAAEALFGEEPAAEAPAAEAPAPEAGEPEIMPV